MTTSLTEVARAGFRGEANSHLFSSPNHFAHALGEYLQTSGRIEPSDVRMGRGYRIWSGDMLFVIDVARGRSLTFIRER